MIISSSFLVSTEKLLEVYADHLGAECSNAVVSIESLTITLLLLMN